MGRTPRDVDEITGPDGRAFAEARAVPDVRLAADEVDGGLAVGVEVRCAAGTRRDHDEMQAERGFAGRRAADARLLVPDTPPAVFTVASYGHPVIPYTGTRNTGIPSAGILDTVSLTTGALSPHAGVG